MEQYHMTPERKLKNQVLSLLRRLKAEGWTIFWTNLAGSPMQRRGLPDLLIVCCGVPIFVELKAGDNKPSKLQERVIKELRQAGAVAEVCRSVGEVLSAIRLRFAGFTQ
jgi:Holliday junction resolvase